MITNALAGTGGAVLAGMENHLWQSTVFAFVMALLTLAFRKNQARTRYWLWFAASMKFLFPLYLLMILGSHATWLHHSAAQSVMTTNPGPYSVADRMSQPFTPGALSTSAPEQAVGPYSAVRNTGFPGLLPTLAAVVWLCGFLYVLGRWAFRFRKLARVVRDALPVHDGREVEALRRVEDLGALRQNIGILVVPFSIEPGIFGLLRPVLLWPAAITDRLDDAHLEAIFAHEISHVRRQDNLTATMHMLVEAVFWFHPLVWWMEARLVEERERACDEDVVRLLHQPGSYAESILKVCAFCVESPLPCVSGVTGADLKKRVVQIFEGAAARKLGLGGKLLVLATISVSIAVPVMLGSTNRYKERVPAPQAAAATNQTSIEAEKPMAKDASPSFLVATIKPSDPNAHDGWGFPTEGHHITCYNASVETILSVAYGIHAKQIVGGPEWINKDRFDINGVPDVDGVPSLKQMQEMYQKLLADRFHLVLHRERRDLPIYAITIAKGGPILKLADPSEILNAGNSGSNGQRTMKFTNMSIADFAFNLNFYEDRPVVDQTSLPGRYDFTLKWTYEVSKENDPGMPPSLFTAMREQLGLRMDAVRGSAEVLVIDHAERPSEN